MMHAAKKRLAAAALAAIATCQAQADTTTFSEGFDDVGFMVAKGWTFYNLSQNPTGMGWYQGSDADAADDGPDGSVAKTGTIASAGDPTPGSTPFLDTWMITPAITLTGNDALHFSIQGYHDADFIHDQLRILVAPGWATSPSQFTEQIFSITDAPSFWLGMQLQLPQGTDSIRVAFEYTGMYQSNSMMVDSVSVTSAVPEPASALMLLAGLGTTMLLRRRRLPPG